jgi:septal ring factor EnvC (AmiA/AmiB activator)
MPIRSATLRRITLVVIVTLSMVATLVAPVSARSSSEEERRLAATQARLTEVRNQLESAKQRRSTDAAELAQAEQQLATVLEALNAAELAVQRQQESVEQARAELARLTDEQAHQQQLMAGRAVALYRQGSGVPLASVLAADSTEEAMQRSTYVEVLTRADKAAFESVEIAQTAVEAQRATLQAEEEILERVAEQQRAIVAEVREMRNERALVLAGSEEALQGLEAQERHLESESREIAALARAASQAEAGARAARAAAAASRSAQPAAAQPASTGGSEPAPASAGGGWTWPARGPVTSEYGRRWGRMHEGIDIGAPTGAAVVAARPGRVTFAGTMGGYGNLVLVDHGGGIVTAYAHLSAFAVSNGAQVGGGQRLGSIGCTGSCTGPHLHFEVRVNGSARNPRNYLG